MDFSQVVNVSILWIFQHYIEVLGTITGLIYLFYSIRGSILLWPFGIFTSALYIYVFFDSKFYADMGLNVYYLLISIYGWYHWLHPDKNDPSGKGHNLLISKITKSRSIILFFITLGIFIVLALILRYFTDSELPYWDAFTTAASITATWMLARKILEHWLIWIVVDAVSAGLYVYKGLFPTVLLFLVYTIMAIIGYIQWKKEWRKIQLET
ncbi:MAG: nicotinamide mononucleotide transporter [Bacteroidales bacterium]|nr:nicotinamide mononucleotide transporter [Bacteroidales bacterium]